MKYRLAPFCSWQRKGDVIILATPDHELTLQPEAEQLLEALRSGWVQETPAIKALAMYRVVVGNESSYLRTLRRLDHYFTQKGFAVRSVRKGSTRPEVALPRECYMLKVEPRTEGYGQASGRNLAMLKAAAEVYERVSCDAIVNHDLLVPEDSGVQALDPELFIRYKDWQLQSEGFPYGKQPSGKWALVRDASTGAPYRLPLEMICYPDRTGVTRVTSVSSSGVACHTSYEAAVLGSVLELIERDALMMHWFWKVAREQILTPSGLRKRVERLHTLGFECTFLNITLELAPVVLVILRRDAQKYPRLIMGMASHANPVTAMDKALQEVELNVTFCDLDTPDIKSAEDVKGVMGHQFWYDKPENHSEVLGLIGHEIIASDDIPMGPATIEDMQSALQSHGFTWYLAELNSEGREVTGLHVIRSLVEGLMSIGFGYMMEPLGLRRILQLPPSVGRGHPDSSRQTREGYVVQPFA